MKKILLIAFAIALVVSCSKDSATTKIEFSSVPVMFVSSITETRASGTEWDGDDVIGIMVTKDGSFVSDYRYNNKHNVVIGSDAEQCTFDAESLLDQLYYSVDEDYTIDFYGYYPYSADIVEADMSYPIDVADQTSPEDIDFMDAVTEVGYSKSSDMVSLTFGHRMAKISLELKAGVGIDDVSEITAVRMEGFYTTANYDFTSFSFVDLGGESVAITPLKDATTGVYSAILIPSNAATHKIYFTTTDGDVALDITTEQLVSGQHSYYTVTVNRTFPTYETNIINGWGEATLDNDSFETE